MTISIQPKIEIHAGPEHCETNWGTRLERHQCSYLYNGSCVLFQKHISDMERVQECKDAESDGNTKEIEDG